MFEFRPIAGEIHVTSPFGAFEGLRKRPHSGVDLRAAVGTPVYAPSAGVVRLADGVGHSNDPGGIELVIQLDNGFRVGFAHLSQCVADKVGMKVTAGQLVAYTGATGIGSGPHLHITLRNRSGDRIDALPFITQAKDPGVDLPTVTLPGSHPGDAGSSPAPRSNSEVKDAPAPAKPAPLRRSNGGKPST